LKYLAIVITFIGVGLLFAFVLITKIPSMNSPSAYADLVLKEDGSSNVVSAIYLDYRLYDSLFEVLVFASAILGISYYISHFPEAGEVPPSDSKLFFIATIAFAPVVAVWGIYILLTGHLSPGGAFSGGAIGASGILFLALAIGSKKTERAFHKMHLESLEKCALLALASYILLGAFNKGFFSPLFWVGTPRKFFSGRGAIILNISIGIKVFVGGWTILYLFSRHRESV